ncbi:SigB/SigF/SigG family RNA polymerase sigma factor [Streptomyces viridochromogenes]|uniref:SigB/SigF/SigG family RNA polymerase sigma factor n=1 Tax=Streptomyces viridochromogenes TaxID=1938 RepID=UPI00268BB9E1
MARWLLGGREGIGRRGARSGRPWPLVPFLESDQPARISPPPDQEGALLSSATLTHDNAAAQGPSRDGIDALLRERAARPPGPSRTALRERAIHELLPLARRVARRFRGRGEDFDDLVQVASLGLIKAVDGYDHTKGHAFLSYALPTVVGELKRHIRDRTATMRLPRPVQEASSQVFQATAELEQRFHGRSPTPEQIAEHTGLEPHRVLSTLRAVRECSPRSLDAPATDDGDGTPLVCLLGSGDRALELVVDTVALASAVQQLTERERRVIRLRFYHEWTQQQIADEIGVSQMQVSRILARSITRLRTALTQNDSNADREREHEPGTRPPTGSAHSRRVSRRPGPANHPPSSSHGPAGRCERVPAGIGAGDTRGLWGRTLRMCVAGNGLPESKAGPAGVAGPQGPRPVSPSITLTWLDRNDGTRHRWCRGRFIARPGHNGTPDPVPGGARPPPRSVRPREPPCRPDKEGRVPRRPA